MKIVFTVLILFYSLTNCAQSKLEFQKNKDTDYRKVEIRLNTVYQEILVEYSSDSIFIERLKDSQRIWHLYRDSELEMKYPKENKLLEYGTIYSTCACQTLIELTEVRIKKLQRWLDGVEEGEVCAGSIKLN